MVVTVIVIVIVIAIVIVTVNANVIALSSILLHGKTVWCFCMVIPEVGTSDRIPIFR
jgi:hypothetical protein